MDKMNWSNGQVCGGEWKYDKMNGRGKRRFPDGAVHEGEYKDDKMHGRGKMNWTDGRVYEGEWENDMRHGMGKMKWSNGEVYLGEWKDDKMHGRGKLTRPHGSSYDAEFENGLLTTTFSVPPAPLSLPSAAAAPLSLASDALESSRMSYDIGGFIINFSHSEAAPLLPTDLQEDMILSADVGLDISRFMDNLGI